jgi:23S rRNA pseudouridine955/2504/2580 synthase
MQTIIINQNDANQRIDGFLRKTFPKLSLSLIYRFLRTKHIKINDKKVSHSYRLQLHDKLEVYVIDELLSHRSTLTDFLLAPKNLSIVYEDDNIMIVNKPIGLIVHSDNTNNVDTLINRVQHYLYDKKA